MGKVLRSREESETILARLREQEMAQYWKKYEENLFGRKTKNFCDDCVKYNIKRGNGTFYPRCSRGADEAAERINEKYPEPQASYYRMTVDPVEWAKFEFDWEPRWYQAQVLRCTAQKQAWRWGRRSGKSTVLAVMSLFLAASKPLVGARDPYTILLITPYESQLERIFDMARDLLSHCRSFKPVRDIRDPHTLEWSNGSIMRGFTAGEKAGSRSTKIRGQDANAIIIDEADYLRDDDIGTVLAILASHADCRLVFSSTPKGDMTRFRRACEDVQMGFREVWVVGQESEEFTIDTDDFYRRMTTQTEYEHEYLALFSQSEMGVFPEELIRKSITTYTTPAVPTDDEDVIIGVDCNEAAAGTHIVVLGCDRKLKTVRVLDVIILSGEQFSHNKSIQLLVDVYQKWKPMRFAMDKGFSHAQIEVLMEWALMNPASGLAEALTSYDLGSNYKFIDPLSGTKISRPYKPLMVGLSQRILQHRKLILPHSQDKDSGIAGQMRAFQVKRIGHNNRPVYTQGNEHTLTAMMIGIMSWMLDIEGINPIISGGALATTARHNVPRELELPAVGRSAGVGGDPKPIVRRKTIGGRKHWSDMTRYNTEPAPRRTSNKRRTNRKTF